MAKMYYEKDCDLNYLNGKKIAVIGYGSQGHAHALNLKDSGCEVCVGLREGSKNWAQAEAAGLTVKTVAEAAKWGDIVMMLINDEVQAEVYKNDIAPYLTEEEKRALCSIAREVRPDFIKTSTGFGTGGATFEDVALMKKCVGDEVKIKAAGGIRTLDTALRMIELGVSRIGSTASVSIVEELKHRL